MAQKAQLAVPNATLDILDEGPQSGPVVLLSHALMCSMRMWDSTVRALHAAGYRTIRYNHVGHGGSAPPQTMQWHFDEFAAHMRAILVQQTGGPKAHAVIGCSMGGVLALRFAMLYPDCVQRVICCDAPGLTSLPESKPKWRARMKQFESEGVDSLAELTVQRWFPDPCPEEVKKAALPITRSCSFEGYCACAGGIMNYNYDEFLPNVKVNTMVLVGDKDEAVGPYEVLEEVARRTPGAEYVRLKDCGHIPAMHRPWEFEKTILNFIRG